MVTQDPPKAAPPPSGPGPARPKKQEESYAWVDWTAAGFEFAAAVLLFFLLGRWLDATWGTLPWLQVAGAGLGVVVGTYLLIKKALGLDRRTGKNRSDGPPDPDAP